jgi:pimeloyl-ACP methyl ester carboxylesterase
LDGTTPGTAIVYNPRMPREWTIERDGVSLAGQDAGEGAPVVLLHGLTATRRYVVMGSTALERSGHRVVSYDARGHGRSSPALHARDYDYERLADDLELVLDHVEVARAVLAGASMGAHTVVAFALRAPQRVAGLALITPAFDPSRSLTDAELARWDALSDGLRTGGIDGFVAAYGRPRASAAFQETIVRVIRQRLAEHQHPLAVADALQTVPRSRPFEALSDLRSLQMPTVIVASGDEADPEHPFAVAQRYADALPHASLVTEEPGASPLAWQGSRLSRVIAELS